MTKKRKGPSHCKRMLSAEQKAAFAAKSKAAWANPVKRENLMKKRRQVDQTHRGGEAIQRRLRAQADVLSSLPRDPLEHALFGD